MKIKSHLKDNFILLFSNSHHKSVLFKPTWLDLSIRYLSLWRGFSAFDWLDNEVKKLNLYSLNGLNIIQ